ncbi:MAG: dihydroorotase [Bacteroides sp.]|nr:dihydroorotase [Bacillota bacterium]MCM1394152.1 dihydroorotase [[Eubacterium] siraeum]MCM1455634.1 dihydroorotase [Bacteroides sp.]
MTALKDVFMQKAGLLAHTQPNVFEDLSFLDEIDVDFETSAILPGFCDVHVHFREPGFSYKETISSGSRAAARGGYTAVCTMPNLNPVPDTLKNLNEQLDIIKRDAVIGVYPYGSITTGEMGAKLSDMADMARDVIAFSDDGRGVQTDDVMLEAMTEAKKLGKIIVAHCEVNELLRGGYIHDGEYARTHGHRGICSESEYAQIERDIALAKRTGCAYHVCHISAKESVELIRQAKADGVDITCETAPHYLVLDEGDLKEDGAFKMNPPLRGKQDRLALIEGILDGTIDMIATDHAPHSLEEKSKGLKGSAFGIVGLETAFPVLYTKLVLNGVISLDKLLVLLSDNPRKRFKIPHNGFSVWDLNAKYKISEADFLSQGKSTPFAGEQVFGKNLLTVYNNEVVYRA